MNVVESRNLFVDSSATQRGESRDLHLSVPQGMMECQDHQTLRVTLSSFQMRKNFYNVNGNNNAVYLYVRNGAAAPASPISYGRGIITPGDYNFYNKQKDPTPGSLCSALEAAVLQAIKAIDGTAAPDCACTWSPITGRLIVDITKVPAAWSDMKLVAFKIKDYKGSPENLITKAVGVYPYTAFQSSSDLLGGCPHTRMDISGTDSAQYDLLTPLFKSTGALAGQAQTFIGDFKAALSTDNAIYVRTNLQNTGYQTAGFDTSGQLFPQIVQTQILAKVSLAELPRNPSQITTDLVPVANPQPQTTSYQISDTPIINYQDKGDMIYSLLLTNRNISEFNLRVTDRLGRLLPPISQEQINCDNMNWTATIRIDVLE